MLQESEYVQRDALGLAALVRSKEVSAKELLETAIARTERINPEINAIVTRMDEHARAELSRGVRHGPFSGVPFLMKDLHAGYGGVETSSGSAWLAETPLEDSIITSRFRESGLLIFGKTNCPEMGLSVDTWNARFGATRNPWDLSKSAGGSSGGAAAAVAARIVPAVHATDGGGSIRIPASNCGLFGLKTSRGRVSFGPGAGEVMGGMSTQHALTLSVRDSAALLDVDSVPEPGDPYWAPPRPVSYLALLEHDPAPLRIAIATRAPNGASTHPECVAAAHAAAAMCEALGHNVVETEPQINWQDGFLDAATTIIATTLRADAEAHSRAIGLPIREDDFRPIAWSLLELALQVSGADYYLAVNKLHALSRITASFHETYDLLLTPTLPLPAQPLSAFDYRPEALEDLSRLVWSVSAFTMPANLCGQPAMSVPLYKDLSGMPVGVQFTAGYGKEDLLIGLAGQLERAVPWFARMPDIAR